MPTERLSDDNKQNISSALDRVIERAMFNKKFPINKKDLFEWLVDQMPQTHQDAYRLLRDENKKLVTNSGSWGSKFKVRDTNSEYTIQVTAKVPYDNIEVRETDSRVADVIVWLKWYEELKAKVSDAESYGDSLVYACTSVGQLRRLLPDEIMRFIPSKLLDFSEVERRSRIPRGFHPDPERMDNMLQMLALGSLSPKERTGLDTVLYDKTVFDDAA